MWESSVEVPIRAYALLGDSVLQRGGSKASPDFLLLPVWSRMFGQGDEMTHLVGYLLFGIGAVGLVVMAIKGIPPWEKEGE